MPWQGTGGWVPPPIELSDISDLLLLSNLTINTDKNWQGYEITNLGGISSVGDINLEDDDIYFTMGAEPANDYTMRFDGTNGRFDENSVGTRFDGNIGIGTASIVTQGLVINKSGLGIGFSLSGASNPLSSYNGFVFLPSFSPSDSGLSFTGWSIGGTLADFALSAGEVIADITAVKITPSIIIPTKNLTSLKVISLAPSLVGNINSYTGISVAPAGTPTISGISYHIKLGNTPTGTGGTYSIHTGTGLVHFGDDVEVVGYVNINSGTLLGTPIAGTFEFQGGKMWLTDVATQRPIDRTSDVAVATVTVANTVTETTLWTGVMAANSLVAGNMFKFHADGIVQNDGAAATEEVTLRIKVNGVTIATLNPTTRAIAAGSFWHLDANATQRTLGSTGSRAVHIDLDIDGVTAEVASVATIDTTASMDVTLTAQWASADVNNTISLYQGFMEYKN